MTTEAEEPSSNYIPVAYVGYKRKRILYVVHRYAPYPGGSENYVRDMAEETLRRGHEVAVFTGDHQGDLNGVRVTSNPAVLHERWDLIVVHGGDVGIQNYVLQQADRLGGPVLYLIIYPSTSPVCVGALHRAQYVGWSTHADWRHLEAFNATHRGVRVRHGIDIKHSMGDPGFRTLFGIQTRYMFLSSGGYWPNKAFDELIETFTNANRTDTTLVLTGYDNRHGIMPKESEFVKPFLFERRADMLSALYDADLYILNSYTEGFGLVLLESMVNMTPWAARAIAGAEVLRDYGYTYTTQQQLTEYLAQFTSPAPEEVLPAAHYVHTHHQVRHTVNDILGIL